MLFGIFWSACIPRHHSWARTRGAYVPRRVVVLVPTLVTLSSGMPTLFSFFTDRGISLSSVLSRFKERMPSFLETTFRQSSKTESQGFETSC